MTCQTIPKKLPDLREWICLESCLGLNQDGFLERHALFTSQALSSTPVQHLPGQLTPNYGKCMPTLHYSISWGTIPNLATFGPAPLAKPETNQ
jgi:hypothetical protein